MIFLPKGLGAVERIFLCHVALLTQINMRELYDAKADTSARPSKLKRAAKWLRVPVPPACREGKRAPLR
jgi:hypothetical protein